ncbi:hypothetical protein ACHAXM_009403 [Skeletonema potamos]|jgi:hypothetical protein
MMTEEDDYAANKQQGDEDSITAATDDFEALLSVPIEIIFREIMQTQIISGGKRTNQRTFLFSKSEVTTLLRVSMLASELTTTMTLVYEALDRVRKGKMYRQDVNNYNRGYLRALLPIIEIHSETSQVALDSVTSETFGISRILQELDDCAMELSKFAETNFNMADQLDWTMTVGGQGSLLSKEKRSIAEIEEAVVERITYLKVMAIGHSDDEEKEEIDITTNNIINASTSDEAASHNHNHNDLFTPMRDLCQKIFEQKEKTACNLNNSSSSEHSQSQIIAAEVMASLSTEDR